MLLYGVAKLDDLIKIAAGLCSEIVVSKAFCHEGIIHESFY